MGARSVRQRTYASRRNRSCTKARSRTPQSSAQRPGGSQSFAVTPCEDDPARTRRRTGRAAGHRPSAGITDRQEVPRRAPGKPQESLRRSSTHFESGVSLATAAHRRPPGRVELRFPGSNRTVAVSRRDVVTHTAQADDAPNERVPNCGPALPKHCAQPSQRDLRAPGTACSTANTARFCRAACPPTL